MLLWQLVMIGAFFAFVIRKAREEFSRTVEQARDDMLLLGPAMAVDSQSKFFGYGFVATTQTDELLIP